MTRQIPLEDICGTALALIYRLRSSDSIPASFHSSLAPRVYVVLGDLQEKEGSPWGLPSCGAEPMDRNCIDGLRDVVTE